MSIRLSTSIEKSRHNITELHKKLRLAKSGIDSYYQLYSDALIHQRLADKHITDFEDNVIQTTGRDDQIKLREYVDSDIIFNFQFEKSQYLEIFEMFNPDYVAEFKEYVKIINELHEAIQQMFEKEENLLGINDPEVMQNLGNYDIRKTLYEQDRNREIERARRR
jgi:hypothetical protein